jgi:hypothetical protein
MKKQLLIIGMTLVLLTVGLSGCNQVSNTINPEINKFVGTWKNTTIEIIQGYTQITNTSYTFFSNGTFNRAKTTGYYELKDGKLFMNYGKGTGIMYDYYFSNNNQTLTLTQTYNPNESKVFTKQ